MTLVVNKMEKDNSYLFEFKQDTLIGALTWHSTCYTGSVECVAPAGMQAYLGEKMNADADFYFYPVRGTFPELWISEVQTKAKAESLVPNRFNGGLSFFVSIHTLLSCNVRFIPATDTPDTREMLKLLQESLEMAIRCAKVKKSDSLRDY